MTPNDSSPLARAQQAYAGFLDGFRSVILATCDAAGEPAGSYAPCILDARRRIVCFVSGLSEHTHNILATGKAGALFLEDESSAGEIFARRRLTYRCDAEILPRDHPEFAELTAAFVARFGSIAERITSMPDFRPLRLTPRSGNFVIGFGAAYAIAGDDLEHLTHVTGSGAGHGHGAPGGGHGRGHGGHGDGAHDGHGHGAGGGHGAGHGHGAGGGHGAGHGHGAGGGHGAGHGHGAGGGHGHGVRGDGEAGEHGVGHPMRTPLDTDGRLPDDLLARIVSHMNGDHTAALLGYAHGPGGRPDVERATLVDLDARGLDLRVESGGVSGTLRVPFPSTLTCVEDVRPALMEMAREARPAGGA